jgi:WD40 repeat protein
MEKYLEILGLSLGASASDIKAAYRKLVKQWHPDRFHNQPMAQQEATKKFQKINEAYQFLIAGTSTESAFDSHSVNSKQKIKVEKISADFYYNLGVEHANQGEENEAIEAFSAAIRCDVNYLKAYQYRGFLLDKLGFVQRAKADFSKVLELKSGNSGHSQTKTKTPQPSSSNKQNQKKETQSTLNTSLWQSVFISNSNSVTAVAISSRGTLTAVGYEGQLLYLWNIPERKHLLSFNGHKKTVRCIVFSADQTRLFSGDEDGKIYVHTIDGSSSKLLGNAKFHHSQAVTSLALTSDGKILLSGSADKTVKIWFLDTTNLEPITLGGSAAGITSLVTHPKNQYFVIGGLDNNIRLRSLENGKLIKSIPVNGGVSSLAISSDGKLLAVGSFNHSISIINLDSREIIQSLQGHQELVSDLSFFDDDQRLISVSWDYTIKEWILKSGKSENVGKHKAPITSAKMSKVQRVLVTGGQDKRIGIWHNVMGS